MTAPRIPPDDSVPDAATSNYAKRQELLGRLLREVQGTETPDDAFYMVDHPNARRHMTMKQKESNRTQSGVSGRYGGFYGGYGGGVDESVPQPVEQVPAEMTDPLAGATLLNRFGALHDTYEPTTGHMRSDRTYKSVGIKPYDARPAWLVKLGSVIADKLGLPPEEPQP